MAFTSNQQQAVEARGKVVVSASAGAGKTTVMIKRLADIICGGVSLDNILAVTFTKKAAAQMKEKLRAELISRLSEGDEASRESIRVQLGKINSADISTIHSFCARLVRTYFYALDGVDASFDIAADGAQNAEMLNRALDDLFDKLYSKSAETADKDFLYVVDRLKRKRGDKTVREAILQAYGRLRIEPDYRSVEQRCEETFTHAGFERVCAQLGALIGERCARLADEVERFRSTLCFASGGGQYADMLCDIEDNLRQVARGGDIFARPDRITSLTKPRVKPENALEDARFAEFLKTIKKRYESLFRGIKTREEEEAAFIESGRLARAFVKIVLAFDGQYCDVKRDEGKLDYADLEHLAYSLLCKEGGADEDVREQIRGKYEYVFVDEYQDVNPIQDAIINAVARGDLFKVGDVKQAIYGFRGSRSHFFAGQLKEAERDKNLYILPHNFRSAPAVIDGVNELFSMIMKPSVCGFDYSEGHAMISGLKAGDCGKAEICLFDGDEREESRAGGVYSITEDIPKRAPVGAECRAIVGLVEELLKSEIYDRERGTRRRVQQGDICILTRKKNKKSIAEAQRELVARGYRVDCSQEGGAGESADIKRLLEILSYIDNSEQDIPLAAALLSPLGGLDEDELAAVRIYGGTGRDAPPFRRCAEKYARDLSDKTAEKLKAFYACIARLKRLAEVLDTSRLIDEIIKLNGFTAHYAREDRAAEVRSLQSAAGAGELPLNVFLRKIKASDCAFGAPASPSSDSIKIMTMHASKGLEFPIVILADIASGFGGEDREDMLYDEQFGFAPSYYDSQKRVYGGTLLKKLCKMRAGAEELKNEINLFYVACTRAKNNLYIMCSEGDKTFDATGVFTSSRYLDLFDINSLEKVVKRHISAGECAKEGEDSAQKEVAGGFAADGELYKKMDALFGFAPKEEGGSLPVKSSATRILNLSAEDEVVPVMFEDDEGGTDTESGLAYHSFLQYCDFSSTDGLGIERQLREMIESGVIGKERAARLDAERLKRIVTLPCFAALNGAEVYREREFLCALTAGEYSALVNGESPFGLKDDDVGAVIVQGAIDMLVVKRDGEGKVVSASIRDYKYSAKTAAALEKRYTPQLALYKKVVTRIYGLNPKDVTAEIVNIRSCEEIPLDI